MVQWQNKALYRIGRLVALEGFPVVFKLRFTNLSHRTAEVLKHPTRKLLIGWGIWRRRLTVQLGSLRNFSLVPPAAFQSPYLHTETRMKLSLIYTVTNSGTGFIRRGER